MRVELGTRFSTSPTVYFASKVSLSLRYYDKGYLSLILALPVFKMQIMLALLLDNKSKYYARFVKLCQKLC